MAGIRVPDVRVLSMLRSLRIQRFRQFRDVKLDGLGQINLITGMNDTGKTSLLEALFLFVNPEDPSRTVTVANLRGIERISSETPGLWEWLFYQREWWQAIEIDGEMSNGEHSRLEINVSRRGLLPSALNPATGDLSPHYLTSIEPLPFLVYDYVPFSGEPVQSVLRWTNQGLVVEPNHRVSSPVAKRGFFLADRHRPTELDAERFSRLEEVGREHDVVEALRVVEPRLKRLTVLTQGGQPTVAADLGRFPLVPLAMMGQGFSRLLTIVSAISLADGTTLMIDELENGFHYSTLPRVWNVIARVAIQHSAQVFATTHSWECIQAAVEGSREMEGSLALFRLERRDNDIEVVGAEDSRLRSAVTVGFEVR